MQTLVEVHSGIRWLVLVALLGGTVLGYVRYRTNAEWNPNWFQLAVMVVDIQVAIGLAIWFFYDGWRREDAFYKVIHPAFMILALGVAHMGFAIAKKRKERRSWLIVAGSFVVSLVLIVGAIPWDRI